MNPLEKQAHDAQAFRIWAKEQNKPHLNLLADGLEKDLSRTLEDRYEASRGVTRPCERHELTREQEATLAVLAADYESVSPARFLPDGSVLADCFNHSEFDGSPELVNVIQIEPGGIPT